MGASWQVGELAGSVRGRGRLSANWRADFEECFQWVAGKMGWETLRGGAGLPAAVGDQAAGSAPVPTISGSTSSMNSWILNIASAASCLISVSLSFA